MKGGLWNFWQLIKMDPTKWIEKDYGDEGGGFWVVAICRTKVIWYNNIEDSFNISAKKYMTKLKSSITTKTNLIGR